MAIKFKRGETLIDRSEASLDLDRAMGQRKLKTFMDYGQGF